MILLDPFRFKSSLDLLNYRLKIRYCTKGDKKQLYISQILVCFYFICSYILTLHSDPNNDTITISVDIVGISSVILIFKKKIYKLRYFLCISFLLLINCDGFKCNFFFVFALTV